MKKKIALAVLLYTISFTNTAYGFDHRYAKIGRIEVNGKFVLTANMDDIKTVWQEAIAQATTRPSNITSFTIEHGENTTTTLPITICRLLMPVAAIW